MLTFNAIVLAIFLAVVFHCDSAPVYTITQQQYTAIQIGWTVTQVTKLVGSSGNVVSQAGTGSASVVIVQYTGTGTTTAIATFGFLGGQLVSKSEFGFDSRVTNKITLQQYTTIQIGWTQQQVTQLLGGTGNVVSQAGISGSSITIVQYTGAQSSSAIATFGFMDGSVSSKSQFGLDTGIYTISAQQYNAIQIGWTRSQVTNLVGSSGNVVSESGTGSTNAVTVQYTGTGTTTAVATFGFLGGQLVSMSEFGFDSTVTNKITLQQYTTIQIGWTQQQVTQLLGGAGNVVSQAGISGSSITIVQYTGAQSSFAIATFGFMGGSVSSKSQFGLDTGIYTISAQQYNAIQIGWTCSQVTNLVASSGNVVSEAGVGSANIVIIEYTGTGTTTAVATFGFLGGKLLSKSEFGFK